MIDEKVFRRWSFWLSFPFGVLFMSVFVSLTMPGGFEDYGFFVIIINYILMFTYGLGYSFLCWFALTFLFLFIKNKSSSTIAIAASLVSVILALSFFWNEIFSDKWFILIYGIVLGVCYTFCLRRILFR